MASSTPEANLTKAKELGKYSELSESSSGNRRPHEKSRILDILDTEDVDMIRKCGGCGKNMSKVKDSLVCSCKKAIHCSKDCFKTTKHKCHHQEPNKISPLDGIIRACDQRYDKLRQANKGPSSEKIQSLLKTTKGAHHKILNYAERRIPMAACVVGTAYVEREFDRGARFAIPEKYKEQSIAETYEIAVKWLKVAAEGCVPEAMYLLFRVLANEVLRVDWRVAHFWLDKAYATGSMDYLVQLLQTPMFCNFPHQFDILFHGVTNGDLVQKVLTGSSFAHLLMATRFRKLKAWDGKTAMGKCFYGFPIFKSVMEGIGELKNEQSVPSLIEGEKKTILVIPARFGNSDFVDKCVSLEREENNLKFRQGVKEKTSPDYQLVSQKTNVDGRTSYLISCKHDKTNSGEAEFDEYSKFGEWGVRAENKNKSILDISRNYKRAGECEPCVQEAQQRLLAVSLGLFSISLTPVFEDQFYAARYAREDGVIVQDVFTGCSKPDMRQLLQCLMSNPADLHPLAIAEDGNIFWPIIWFWGSVYEAVKDTCDKITLNAIYHRLGKKIDFAKNENASGRAAFPEAAVGEWRMACGNESCVNVDHEAKMSLCKGCKVRRYCDEACQSKDWAKHMKFCKAGKK